MLDMFSGHERRLPELSLHGIARTRAQVTLTITFVAEIVHEIPVNPFAKDGSHVLD